MENALYKRRQERLGQLILSKKLTVNEIAEAVGVMNNYVSQVRHGHKNLSGDKAREWEKSLGLPAGWLDGDEPISDVRMPYHGYLLTRAGAELAAEWEKLPVGDRAEIEALILTRVARQKRDERKARPPDDPPPKSGKLTS